MPSQHPHTIIIQKKSKGGTCFISGILIGLMLLDTIGEVNFA